MDKADLLLVARQGLTMPEWATHVAVRNDGSKVEACIWSDKGDGWSSDNPELDDDFIGGNGHRPYQGVYDLDYWEIIDIGEL